jgi:uncharacterized protein YbaP (TraB family)
MKKTVIVFALFIATYNIFAQTETYKSGAVLWKISGKDLSKPSYLLGTLHFKSGKYLDSIPGATAALQSCEQVAGEIPLSDMADLQKQMMQAMKMTADTTYKMLYSEDDYRFVSEKLASVIGSGLDGPLATMKPAAIQIMVVALTYAKHFPNLDPASTLDIRIQSDATKEQKPVMGLETADDQIYALFGIMDLQRQADALLCSLKEMDESLAEIPGQIEAYNQGNLNKLYQQFEDNEDCPSTPSEMNALNKDRNDAWMKKLPEIMKDKSSFIAVGALHLAGKEGLLNQLEKAGYKVEAVRL